MRSRHLYQSVEDRGRVEYTPIFCEAKDAWLGQGYYFWDSEINDAHWWGQEHYNGFYVICQSKYDYDSLEYFDLLGNTDHRKYLFTFCRSFDKQVSKTIFGGGDFRVIKTNRQIFFTELQSC